MERLTKRIKLPNGESIVDFSNEVIHEFTGNHEKGIRALFKRVAGYEDTNLAPEQMLEIDKTFHEQAKELAELKKQLPPCNIGGMIYVIPSKTNYELNKLHKYYDNNRVYAQEISEIRLYSNGYLIVTCEGMCSAVDVSYKETWFLTKEEAEAKLKEMEGK